MPRHLGPWEIATPCVRRGSPRENHARTPEQEVPRLLTREHWNALDLSVCLRSLFRRNRQHSILHLSVNLIRINVGPKRQRPLELTMPTFTVHGPVGFRLLLALDCQHSVCERNVDVLLIHP